MPQTGPLPGAYPKDALAELEERVARGELSLRGVNPLVLDIDETLLANVNTRMDLLAAAVADWAREREDVRAAIVVGSQARADAPADRWSDLDIALFVDDPRALAEDASWIESFGTPVLTFLEPTGFGDRVERRVLYETGEDVDFPLLPAAEWRELAGSAEARVMLARGCRILHDELGLAEALAELTPPDDAWPPDAAALRELSGDFWYHALWTAKKLRRGEVFTAIGCLDGYLQVAAGHAHRRGMRAPSTRRWTHGTAVASSSAGQIRGRSRRSRRRSRTTTCGTSRVRSGR